MSAAAHNLSTKDRTLIACIGDEVRRLALCFALRLGRAMQPGRASSTG